ncbi:helix-turn-helix transcriptional regulator [Aeromonas hydrophila]|uniref:helix-turn-helix domain-containing protein n=1 Tax=Aeromonas hydrophila TaxID=644 RepID=UPI0029DB2103|nr:helix-turn-helix transcriptional regulator [Aeromonas hydrophila]MDX7778269.1 helix-turn-helix transcriptional regulator [Aeromonas hydrophila]
MRTRKNYLTAAESNYVSAAKQFLSMTLESRGVTPDQLSLITGIPASTISRWLSKNRDEFMTLADAALICRHLGIDVQHMLPPATWSCEQPESAKLVIMLMGIPFPHLRWLTSTYDEARKLFRL